MRSLNKFLGKLAKLEARIPRLEEALITNRTWSYAVYRLRFLLWRVLLRASLHLVEITIFAMVFMPEFLGPLIMMRAGMAILGGLWWGALEQLREAVRKHATKRNWYWVRRVIDAWLMLSILLGMSLTGFGTWWILEHPSPRLGFSVFDAYLIACLLRLNLDMFARTYHSGLYAIRRIYRPLWSLLLGDFLDLALIIILFPYWGLWGFSFALLIVGIIRVSLMYYFVHSSYKKSKVPAWKMTPWLKSIRYLGWRDLVGMVKHAIANFSSQVDSLLIVALVASSAKSPAEGQIDLAIVFYLLRPFIGAAFGWTRLFYFDFVKLRDRFGQMFKLRFERFMRRLAIAVPVVLAVLSAAWLMLISKGTAGYEALMMLPFLTARSFLGLYQIQAFSYGKYKYLIILTALVVGGALGVSTVPLGGVWVLGILSVLMFAIVFVMRPPKARSNLMDDLRGDRRIVSLPRWLSVICETQVPLRIGAARIAANQGTRGGVAHHLSTLLDAGMITRGGLNTVLWFELEGDEEPLDSPRAAVEFGGAFSYFFLGSYQPDGVSALKTALADETIPPSVAHLIDEGRAAGATRKRLLKSFLERFTDGKVLDARNGYLNKKRDGLDLPAIRRILGAVSRLSVTAARDRGKLGALDVSVYCPSGEPDTVFVASKTDDVEQRAAWRKEVDAATLATSVKPVFEDP